MNNNINKIRSALKKCEQDKKDQIVLQLNEYRGVNVWHIIMSTMYGHNVKN